MPDFTVDIGGLTALENNLHRTNENIDSATKRLRDLGPADLGPQDLDDACADFRDVWEGGLGELRDAVDEVKGGLTETKKAYAELENALRGTFQKMSDHMGQQGSGQQDSGQQGNGPSGGGEPT